MTKQFDELLESLLSEMMPADIGDFGSATQKILGRVPPGEPKGHYAPLQKLSDEDRRKVVEEILREVFNEKDGSYTATVDTPEQLNAAIKSAIQKVSSRTSLKASGNWAAQFLADRLMSSLKDTVKFTTMGGEEINVKPTQKEFKDALDKAIKQAPSGPSVWDNKEAKEKKAAAAAEEPEESAESAEEAPDTEEEPEAEEQAEETGEITDEEEIALDVLKDIYSKTKKPVALKDLMQDKRMPLQIRDSKEKAREVYGKLMRVGWLQDTDNADGDYIEVGHSGTGYEIRTKSKEDMEVGGETLEGGEEGEDFDSVVQDRAKKLQMAADPYGKREFVKKTIARDYEGGSTRDYEF